MIFLFNLLVNISKLFKIALNKQVFPDPISPIIPTDSSFLIFKLISFSKFIITVPLIISFSSPFS